MHKAFLLSTVLFAAHIKTFNKEICVNEVYGSLNAFLKNADWTKEKERYINCLHKNPHAIDLVNAKIHGKYSKNDPRKMLSQRDERGTLIGLLHLENGQRFLMVSRQQEEKSVSYDERSNIPEIKNDEDARINAETIFWGLKALLAFQEESKQKRGVLSPLLCALTEEITNQGRKN